nr:unnamed protein product [Callosobruchus chinensis]
MIVWSNDPLNNICLSLSHVKDLMDPEWPFKVVITVVPLLSSFSMIQNTMAHLSRIIVLIDMDCFYCQVEEKLEPSMVGKPIAVVQYNPWRGGGIIAVNYPARDKGVTRHMRGDEAKQKCPDIVLARVPQVRGKADISKYREAGNRVAEVLQTFTNLLERASIDEAYLDITEAVEKS